MTLRNLIRAMLKESIRDIAVTIPRSRMQEIEQEEIDVANRQTAGETGIEYYWQMGRLPKVCPKRIYFVWDNAVRAYHDVIKMSTGEKRIYMQPQIHEIDPVPMKAFRGFRYYDS